MVLPSAVLIIPRCGVQLSGMIASVFLGISVRDGANIGKANRIERTQLFAFLNYFRKPVVRSQESPVIHITVFENTLNEMSGIFIHIRLIFVHVPKQNVRQLSYTFFATHNCCKDR